MDYIDSIDFVDSEDFIDSIDAIDYIDHMDDIHIIYKHCGVYKIRKICTYSI